MALASHLHHFSVTDEDAPWLASIGVASEPGGCRAEIKHPDGCIDSRWLIDDSSAADWLLETMQPGDEFELRTE
jgi:hypothetical protein